jgi:hypothetical protein
MQSTADRMPALQSPPLGTDASNVTEEPAFVQSMASETSKTQSLTQNNRSSKIFPTNDDTILPFTVNNNLKLVDQNTALTSDNNSQRDDRLSARTQRNLATGPHETHPLRQAVAQTSGAHSSEATGAANVSIQSKELLDVPFLATAHNDPPAQWQAARSETKPPLADSHSATLRNINEQMHEAKDSSASGIAHHQSEKSGPKVVIGTVEVRARIMQSAPAVPAPVQQIADRNFDQNHLQSGTRLAQHDSLARSLGWHYGLIQG